MRTNNICFPSEVRAKIVKCVEDAVKDDILADIQHHSLRTTNSVPTRIWDLLNTNLARELETEDCTIADAHRGPWQMLVVFERTTQCILTFMREKRFAELRRFQRRRRHMHYLDMLTRQFNKELLADQQQVELYPHTFSDEDKLPQLVQTLLHDLEDEIPVVQNHVLILFETTGYQLSHIRAVKVTPNLDIAQDGSQDWSEYISTNVSIVVEKVAHSDAPGNQPNRGLKLKSKAIARKKNGLQRKETQEIEAQG